MTSGEKISVEELKNKVAQLDVEDGDIILMEDMGLPTDATKSLGAKLYEQTGLKLVVVPDLDKLGVLKVSKFKNNDEQKEEEEVGFLAKLLGAK